MAKTDTEETMRLIDEILVYGGCGYSMDAFGNVYIPLSVLRYKPYKAHPQYRKNTRLRNGEGHYIMHCMFFPLE